MEPRKRATQPVPYQTGATQRPEGRRLSVVRGAAEKSATAPLAEPLRLIKGTDHNSEFLNAVQSVDVEKVRQLAEMPGVDLHVGLKIADRMRSAGPRADLDSADKAAGLDVIIRLMAEAASSRV